VVLLWSVFVDGPPPDPPPPRPPPTVNPDPAAAEAKLYAALDALRRARGLPALQRFPLFEPLAREHSALLAARGVVAHAVPGPPVGCRPARPGSPIRAPVTSRTSPPRWMPTRRWRSSWTRPVTSRPSSAPPVRTWRSARRSSPYWTAAPACS
jgi:hypothetical protein